MSEQLAYLAGYFDGEGTVTVNTNHGRLVSLRIAVATADKVVLEKFVDLFGGSLYQKPGVRRQMWQWVRNGKDAQETLAKLFPWLSGKRQVALIGLLWPIEKFTGRKVPALVKTDRGILANALHAVNNRVTI